MKAVCDDRQVIDLWLMYQDYLILVKGVNPT
jgi:hypothetical protein